MVAKFDYLLYSSAPYKGSPFSWYYFYEYILHRNVKNSWTFSYLRLPVVLTDQVGSHLFEVILQTADEESFDNLTTRCMKKILISLSIHPIANFLVQTLLRCIEDKEKVCCIRQWAKSPEKQSVGVYFW